VTLNNPSDEEKAEFSKENLASRPVKYVIWQVELGESGTPHIQAYIALKVKKRISYFKEWLPRAHLEIARGTPLENKAYCSKEEGRIEGPFEFGNLPPGKGARLDLEAFRSSVCVNPVPANELVHRYGEIYAKYPKYCRELNAYYRRARYLETLPKFVPLPGWQCDLVETLRGPVDPRKVIWIWEETGSVGKSYFCRHFRIGEGAGELGYIITGGKYADIQFGYNEEKVVYFDWARDQEEQFPYVLIEHFKNGYFFSPKYESRGRIFDPPHVVVFANFAPNTGKLSQDRWDIRPVN